MKSGRKRQPTLSDIAEKVGVAAMTVSRVVNGDGYVSEKTRNKVLKAIKDLHYRQNAGSQPETAVYRDGRTRPWRHIKSVFYRACPCGSGNTFKPGI